LSVYQGGHIKATSEEISENNILITKEFSQKFEILISLSLGPFDDNCKGAIVVATGYENNHKYPRLMKKK
jgi:hypothetical protein